MMLPMTVVYSTCRCLDALRRMQQSASRQNRFAEIGLTRLYDVQLTAKYAYTGFLGNFYFDCEWFIVYCKKGQILITLLLFTWKCCSLLCKGVSF